MRRLLAPLWVISVLVVVGLTMTRGRGAWDSLALIGLEYALLGLLMSTLFMVAPRR